MSIDRDVQIAEWMTNRDNVLKGNPYHTGWYDVVTIANAFNISRSSAKYWLEKGVKHGIFERQQCNLGHGFYWWYEFKVL